ncbi:hypothetical protein BCF33_2075 [Hasllibacter halocynthiae]|uniref:Flagellar protein FliL n=1 Tax=Hasllibacter halocynthiae TaxID=595589 RepID=A0A2T0X2P7_9RHOB|nr:flagellar basal body-associated FliL family protein [Hasllibacter halocynthiae]PRY93208.1 hypothetical protein BCF33_2075 [Hasllibacter halocynthiae]
MGRILGFAFAILAGAAAGGGAAWWTAPPAGQPGKTEEGEPPPETPEETTPGPTATVTQRLANQFVLPLMSEEGLLGHVVLTLAVEMDEGAPDVHPQSPRLRDAFLSALSAHRADGGFGADVASPEELEELRAVLLRAGRSVLGEDLRAVLIGDLSVSPVAR